MLELTDDQRNYLMAMRGGCRCQDPGARPPCGACETPPSNEELVQIAQVYDIPPEDLDYALDD